MSDDLYPRPMASKILERQRFNNAFLAKLVKYIVSFYVFQYMEIKKLTLRMLP